MILSTGHRDQCHTILSKSYQLLAHGGPCLRSVRAIVIVYDSDRARQSESLTPADSDAGHGASVAGSGGDSPGGAAAAGGGGVPDRGPSLGNAVPR